MNPMNKRELQVMVERLKEHFSSATAGDCSLLISYLSNVPLDVALDAIEEHHGESGKEVWRPDCKRIRSICWETLNNLKAKQDIDWPDAVQIIRKLMGPKCLGKPDKEVMTRYWAQVFRRACQRKTELEKHKMPVPDQLLQELRGEAKKCRDSLQLMLMELEEFRGKPVEAKAAAAMCWKSKDELDIHFTIPF